MKKFLITVLLILVLFIGLAFLVNHKNEPAQNSDNVQVIFEPSTKEQKQADKVITTKSQIEIPVKDIEEKAKTGQKETIDTGRVVTTVTDRDGRVIGKTEGNPGVSIEDGKVKIDTETKLAITVPDNPMKLFAAAGVPSGEFSLGAAYRVYSLDLKILKPDVDLMATFKGEIGAGLSQKFLKTASGSWFGGAGILYDPGGDNSWMLKMYIATSFR
jgi:uncharacterized protein YxeA